MSRILVLAVAIALAFGAGRLSLADDDAPKTVKAKQYRIQYAESALDLSHGASRWVDELFLPDEKVAALLLFDHDVGGEPGEELRFEKRVRLFAYAAKKPRNELTGIGGTPSEIEDIEIPADLAKEIVALAKLTACHQAETLRLGRETVRRLGWKELPRGQ